jgi:hypothetical protein
VALVQIFSEYFGFPYQFSFHQLLHTHQSSGTGTIGQTVAGVPSALSLTLSQELKKQVDIETVLWGDEHYLSFSVFVLALGSSETSVQVYLRHTWSCA